MVAGAREGRDAAIGSRLAAELYGCEVLAEGVEDRPGNETRFVWLAPASEPSPPPTAGAPSKTSVVFWGPGDDAPGALVGVLHELADRGVNLTKIESRPRRVGLGHYMFFLDLDGHEEEPRGGRGAGRAGRARGVAAGARVVPVGRLALSGCTGLLVCATVLAAYATTQDAGDPLAGLEVGERPEPDPPEGFETIEVRAAALNHHDYWALRGVGLDADRLPMILGSDAAGVTADGREVIAYPLIAGPDGSWSLLSERHPGTLAQRVAVPSASLIDKPAELSFEQAACLPTAWLTAYRMLFSARRPAAGAARAGAGRGRRRGHRGDRARPRRGGRGHGHEPQRRAPASAPASWARPTGPQRRAGAGARGRR